MDRIMIAAYGCIAVAFGIAYVSALGDRRLPKRPCSFCGAELSPPLYACSHVIGDGRGTPANGAAAISAREPRYAAKRSA
jgi:hypothetical protein